MFNLTVGQLLEFIQKNNIPMDAKILYERIEDHYFREGTGWGETSVKKADRYDTGEDQFVAVFTCMKYNDDNDLYLTAHH